MAFQAQPASPVGVQSDSGMSRDTWQYLQVLRQFGDVVNYAINAILIWPLNNDMCKYLIGFAFNFGDSLPSANGSGSISTHYGILHLPLSDPGMTSPQCDPLCHSVYLTIDHQPLSTI
ncbi:hypothetical protein DSO57_1016478 [Entomophthora muscae]|uniref:Uncharacterized protein n=2 Tax=Entomophthora muscae TaxID=34485 RepID=A0ACC2STK3_9FUNG|nr:hypothetical protein DSO57_1016478 [Entomophthora muscae]